MVADVVRRQSRRGYESWRPTGPAAVTDSAADSVRPGGDWADQVDDPGGHVARVGLKRYRAGPGAGLSGNRLASQIRGIPHPASAARGPGDGLADQTPRPVLPPGKHDYGTFVALQAQPAMNLLDVSG